MSQSPKKGTNSPTRQADSQGQPTKTKTNIAQALAGSLLSKVEGAGKSQQATERKEKELKEEAEAKRKRDAELNQVKNKLYTYVSEIVNRQNEGNEVLSFESFQVETAARKVLKELIDYFIQRDEQWDKIVNQVKLTTDKYKGKVDAFEVILKKVQSVQFDTEGLFKRMSKIVRIYKLNLMIYQEGLTEQQTDHVDKQVGQVKEIIKTNKEHLESKLEIINIYDQRFSKLDKENQRLRELIHVNRDNQALEINEERQKIGRLESFVNGQLDKLSHRIEQNKFFIGQNKESMQSLDSQVATFKTQLQLSIEKLDSENERRMLTEEFKRSMRQMNEFLLVKFREMDDIRNSVRDNVTYNKLYSPMMTQMMINDNVTFMIRNQESDVFDEEKFIQFQQQRLDILMQNIAIEKNRAERMGLDPQSRNYSDQMNEIMIKYAIPREEKQQFVGIDPKSKQRITFSGQSVEQFMTELIKAQIDDARNRLNKQKLFSSGYMNSAESLRQATNLVEIQELIERIESRTDQYIKKAKKQYEEILQQRKERLAQQQKMLMMRKRLEEANTQNEINKTTAKRTRSYRAIKQEAFFDVRDKARRYKSRMIKYNKNNVDLNGEKIENGSHGEEAEDKHDILSQENQYKDPQYFEQYIRDQAKTMSKMKIDFKQFVASQDAKYEVKQNDSILESPQAKSPNINASIPFVDGAVTRFDNQDMRVRDSTNDINMDKQSLQQTNQNVQQTDSASIMRPDASVRMQYLDVEQTQQYKDKPRRKTLNNNQQFELMPGQMNKLQRKKLVQDLKEEIQAIMASSIELKVSEYTSTLQAQIRKVETSVANYGDRISERFAKDLDDVRIRFKHDFEEANAQLIEDIKYLKKQRARDKSDYVSMTLESVNMQIHSEEQDIMDRKKMALVGSKDQRLKVQELYGSVNEKVSKAKLSQDTQATLDPFEFKDQSSPKNINQTLRSNSNDSQRDLSQLNLTSRKRGTSNYNIYKDPFTQNVKVDYPIKLDQTCLSCQVTGHDLQQVLYMFKVACISYQPTDIIYRSKPIQRVELLKIRKQMMEKSFKLLQKTALFKQNAIYPKRYYDDLVLEDSLLQNSLLRSGSFKHQGSQIDQLEPINQQLPFGIGHKQDFKEAMHQTMNNTNTTFSNNDNAPLEQRYTENAKNTTPLDPLKAIKGLHLTISKNDEKSRQHKMGIRNLSISHYDQKLTINNTNFTTRNFNNTTIEPHRHQTEMNQINMNSTRQSNQSVDSQRKPNFDIEEIIKNPNAEIKKYTKAFHSRIKNQTQTQVHNIASLSNLGVQYPIIKQPIDSKFTSTSRTKVVTQLGFQDLPKITK
ncbi:UNKNOWN [Stylonychia lemnae]|uniref:Uncharacterized protein n=1 Tax=Stylonychia lemnae TaxID=5949 RepID=A0A078AMU0_STYLE|nr:UNKNOWN [Stylonychia lemnae]|eukprot:CDW82193.1 UNKNOWN [Stylonychia lemnae]